MSWLAGQTKWWLILAAVLGAAITWLLMLRRVKVSEQVSRGATRGASAGGARKATVGDSGLSSDLSDRDSSGVSARTVGGAALGAGAAAGGVAAAASARTPERP